MYGYMFFRTLARLFTEFVSDSLYRHLFWIITLGLHNFIPVLYCMKYQFSLLSVQVTAGMWVEGLVIMLCVWYLLISERISLSRHVLTE